MSQTYTFLLKQGTLAEWAATNPVLQRGEPGVEYDTGKMKLGDGTTRWSLLPYFVPGSGVNSGPTGLAGLAGLQGPAGPTGLPGPTGVVFSEVLTSVTGDYIPAYFSPSTGKFAFVYPPITNTFSTSNNSIPNSLPGVPRTTFQLPSVSSQYRWSAAITAIGGNGTPTTVTKLYPGGQTLYIQVGNPGSVVTFPTTLYLPGGASGVLETDNLITTIICQSNGGTVNASPSVVITLSLTIA
jgi:hypothetical protein